MPKTSSTAPGETVVRILALILVLALSVWIYLHRDAIVALSSLGYLGVFLVSLLSNATVIFPAPSLVLPFTMGAVLSPWLVALVAALGAALGELTGYLAGYSGQAIIEDKATFARVSQWMREARSAALVIFILAFLPLPLMDLAGIAAGALKMPVSRFLFWCFWGKLLKLLIVALAGAWSLPWMSQWLTP